MYSSKFIITLDLGVSEFCRCSLKARKCVKKHKSSLDPQLKITARLLLLTHLSVEARVNEAQSTDTTLVHKHEQQT